MVQPCRRGGGAHLRPEGDLGSYGDSLQPSVAVMTPPWPPTRGPQTSLLLLLLLEFLPFLGVDPCCERVSVVSLEVLGRERPLPEGEHPMQHSWGGAPRCGVPGMEFPGGILLVCRSWHGSARCGVPGVELPDVVFLAWCSWHGVPRHGTPSHGTPGTVLPAGTCPSGSRLHTGERPSSS